MKTKVIEFSKSLLSIILILAGLLKLFSIEYFSLALLQYGINYAQVGIFAKIISIYEISLGTILLVGVQKRLTAVITLLTFFSFTLIALYDFKSGNLVTCGCFGGIRFLEASPFLRIILNFILASISFIVLISDKSKPWPWAKARWVYAAVGTLALGTIIVKEIKSSYEDSSSTYTQIIYLSDQYLSEFKNEFIQPANSSSVSVLINGQKQTFRLADFIKDSDISLLLLFTPFDCRACFSSINELPQELMNGLDIKIQMIGISLEGRYEQLIRFSNDLSFGFPVYVLGERHRTKKVRTPALVAVTKDGKMLYGCEIKPIENLKRQIFFEIKSKIKVAMSSKI